MSTNTITAADTYGYAATAAATRAEASARGDYTHAYRAQEHARRPAQHAAPVEYTPGCRAAARSAAYAAYVAAERAAIAYWAAHPRTDPGQVDIVVVDGMYQTSGTVRAAAEAAAYRVFAEFDAVNNRIVEG